MRHAPRRPRKLAGFTLMELMIVMMIIGILLSFILVAAVNAARAAQERATQALIAKLDSGLADRIEALMAQRVDPSNAHLQMAYVWAQGRDYTQTGFNINNDRDAYQRAGVLARYDQIKAEIPDVFIVQGGNSYPLNYAMPPGPSAMTAPFNFVLPLGTGVSQGIPGATPYAGTGIYGASYTVHASINRNLGKYTSPTTGQQGAGYPPQLYNGVDDNGDALIDNLQDTGSIDSSVTNALASHKHITARAEMLYAVLVEGQGPFGSVFNRDDFTNNEVKDTDQDGLPEFVDGWGNPLQFYRWPLLFHSDTQRGLSLVATGASDANVRTGPNAVYNAVAPYTGPFDTREQDPLDPNQQLLMPDWWSSASNTQNPLYTANGPLSGGAVFFQTYFHLLVDPLAGGSGLGLTPANNQQYWDRSVPNASFVPLGGSLVSVTLYPRRAFYSRFLILSAGPDGQPGVPYLTDWERASEAYGSTPPSPPFYQTDTALQSSLAGNARSIANLLMIECQAAQATLSRSNDIYQTPTGITSSGGDLYTDQLQSDGQDDITNHNLMSSALPVQ